MKTFQFPAFLLNRSTIFFALISIILVSCKSGESMADQGIIQKRKFQKGYHVNIKSPFQNKTSIAKYDKETDKSFTASIKSELPSYAVKPMLSLPVVKESVLNTEQLRNRKKSVKKRSIQFTESNVADATASVDPSETIALTPNSWIDKSDTAKPFQDYYLAKRVNTLALLSFIFALLSLLILGIPFGIAAVVCGIIGLTQIEKSPDRYKGRGFAIVGIVIGLIAVIVVIAALSVAA